ncbi:MAG: Serine/threonine phosphatase stp [Candidatus Accumulibacter sp. BA-94]|jgi:protein phosphatase|uniref:PP2C family protein-serine/threonine phosphatase n=1 Tax=Accumulibacter sp. TaxID=2053492 RepID=UPI00044ED342|nr:protein phosphatase 2C domain-containing protein [Accumulibacter sp.]EXI83716.1 MAG: Serine/threonine phosphatase stp [Candidatus Accumulibacter sp. BA-94]MBL8390683.1 serine/threonine-protein phosphatase [Accumulibacter sp.]HRD87626.1 protein phosphatase 2C domain-containing protein [Accumulibacter sp.]
MTTPEQSLQQLPSAIRVGGTGDERVAASGPCGVSTMDYGVEAHLASNIGRIRSSNQDSLAFFSPAEARQWQRRGVLVVMADGMGGHNAGEVASSMAVETLGQSYFANGEVDPGNALSNAMHDANLAIAHAAAADSALAGMGTTATALILVGSRVLFAHVGDSRVYRCRGGRCRQLTVDHTVAAEMARNGLLSTEQARHHPARNILLLSLGSEKTLRVATQADAPPVIGDSFVLCSDGLWESVDAAEIGRVVARLDAAAACRRLIELALARDGSDNVSLAIISIGPPVQS